jgi:O-antigen ligase
MSETFLSGRADRRPSRAASAVFLGALCLTVILTSVRLLAVVPMLLAIFVWLAFAFPKALTVVGAIAASVIRPSLDLFASVSLPGGNPASVFGGIMLIWGVVVGMARVYRGLPLWPNRRFAIPQLLLIALHVVIFIGGLEFSGMGEFAVGARELARFSSITAAGFLAVWWQDDSHDSGWHSALLVVLASSVIPIAAGILQAVNGTGNHEDGNLNRVFGSFTHPLSYGSYLLPLVVLGIAGVVRLRGSARFLAAAYAFTTATLLFLTYNRTTILLVAFAIVLYSLLELARFRMTDVVRLAAGLAIVLTLGWIVFGNQVAERFSDVSITAGAVQEALSSGSQNSFQWRIVNWAVLIQLGLAHPLIGHGLGMTTVLNPLIQASSGIPFNAHDDYVRFFFEGGITGLALYVLFVGSFSAWLLRARKNLRAEDVSIVHAIIAALACLFVLSLGTTEMSLQSAVLSQSYLLMAIVAGAESRRDSALNKPLV